MCVYRLQDVAKSVRCKASSRFTACTVICSHLVVFQATSGKYIDRASVVKPPLESSRSYDDRLIVAEKSNDSTGSHEPTHGQPTCSVRARGPHHSHTDNPRAAYMHGVHIIQATDYPRAAYTLRGLQQANQGVLAWSLHPTALTLINPRITHVQPSRYGAHTSQVRSYPRVGALRGPQ